MKKAVLLLLLLPFVVVLLAYVGYGGSSMIDAHRKAGEAADDIERGLPPAREKVTAQLAEGRQVAGEVTEPAYRWEELSCELTHRDAGWMVQHYVNACKLRTTELWPSATSTSGGCRPQRVRSDDYTVSVTVVRATTSTLTRPTPADPCPSVLPRKDRHDWDPVVRRLSGKPPHDLEGEPAWLVVQATADVSDSDLGCHHWSVLFCDQPRDEPVLPDH